MKPSSIQNIKFKCPIDRRACTELASSPKVIYELSSSVKLMKPACRQDRVRRRDLCESIAGDTGNKKRLIYYLFL